VSIDVWDDDTPSGNEQLGSWGIGVDEDVGIDSEPIIYVRPMRKGDHAHTVVGIRIPYLLDIGILMNV